jgi:hypothetical protein
VSQPLPLPQRWVDQLLRQRAALLRPVLDLSLLPGGLSLPPGCSTEDVSADLERGAWLVRDQLRSGWYRLGGDEFEVSVRSRPAEEGKHLLAVAYEANPVYGVPPTVRMRPRVRFVPVFDEVGCDLAAVLAQLDAAGAVRTQLRRPRQTEGSLRHGSLRGKVSKEYGQLGTLLKLLAERAARLPDLELDGVVLPGDQVRVELDHAAAGMHGRRVTIQVDGDDEYRTQVNRVRGRVLTVDPMRTWQVPAGTRVRVVAASRFAMRQNAEALDRFQQGAVEGAWADLATLLCDTKQLELPEPVPMPAFFFCDRDPETEPLNTAQRQAVAGALATPHAFLVQGPPGTGKTTVISELIQQLIARGERVLMLAPSHVAVDEVLSRVGPKPGVRALRITWSSDKVDARLHPYLFDRVGRDLADRALREGADRQARWQRRAAELAAQLAVLTACRDAALEQRSSTEAYEAAAQELARLQETRDADLAGAERDLDRLADEYAAAQRAEQDTGRAAADSADALTRRERELRPRLVATRDAAGEAVTALEAVERARAVEAPLADRLSDLTTRIDEAEKRLRQWRRFMAETEPGVDAELAAAQRRLAEVRAKQQRWSWAAPLMPDLGLAVTKAERAWRNWSAHRAALDRSADAAARDEHTLQADRRQWDTVRYMLQRRTEARTEAESAWAAAAERMAARLAEAVGTEPRRPDVSRGSLANWQEICTTLHRTLSTFLNDPAQAPSLPDRRAFRRLAALLDGYRETVHTERDRSTQAKAAGARARRLAAAYRERQEQVAALRDDSALSAAAALAEERRAAMQAAIGRRLRLGDETPLAELEEQRTALVRERAKLQRYQRLRERWEQLTAGRQTDNLVEDVRRSFVRATNLVCATTKGIVSGGSQPVRDTDYDTLIVDEASRVTESEFLIGAVRARRWILVGDEYQLPPHVDGEDEYHLHALTAIHRYERGAAASVSQAVDELAKLWEEDEELHAFRRREVTALAEKLLTSGDWADGYRDTFVAAYRYFPGDDGDAALLRSMLRHLVHSLFQRAVLDSRVQLRRRLLEQRRMVPALSRIVRQPVYRGEYDDPEPAALERIGLRPITTPTFPVPAIFIDTSRYEGAGDTQVGNGFVNPLEREAVRWALGRYDRELREAGLRAASFSVLAFYKAQATALAREIDGLRLQVLERSVVDVIDAIQGQQADIVVLSFTRAADGRVGRRFGTWLQDLRRLNVACTRARRALVLVGHARTLRQLAAVDQAKRFYDHLFRLFATDPENFRLLERFK